MSSLQCKPLCFLGQHFDDHDDDDSFDDNDDYNDDDVDEYKCQLCKSLFPS